MPETLKTFNLTIGYTSRKRSRLVVAEKINVRLDPGEFVCLIGPNGAGKSTLLRTIAGLQKPLDGDVTLNGASVYNLPPGEIARHLSVVLTDRPTVGFMTVYSVVTLGRYPYTNWAGGLSSRDEEIVWKAIKTVGIEELSDRLLNELSDGERQKVMIARALAQEPKIMVLDEATAFLDLPRRVELMLLLRKLARESNIAVLLSTHDLDLALKSSDRLWLLPKGGPIITGVPEDLVLNGSFSSVFDGSSAAFDRGSGTFIFESPERGRVVLESSFSSQDVFVTWTRRALVRAGYRIVSDESIALRVAISNENGSGTVWRIICKGKEEALAHSLEDLIFKLGSMADAA